MISKDDYLKSVEAIDKFLTEDNELFENSKRVINTMNFNSLWNMVDSYVELLNKLTDEYDENTIFPSSLETYLYSKETEEDTMGSLEDFYDNYIEKESTFADKLRSYTDEQLADFIYDVYKTGRVSGKVVENTRLTSGDVLDILKAPKAKYSLYKEEL